MRPDREADPSGQWSPAVSAGGRSNNPVIQKTKKLVFSLNEAQKLLEIRYRETVDYDEVISFAGDNRGDIWKQIERHQRIESVLFNLIDEYANNGSTYLAR